MVLITHPFTSETFGQGQTPEEALADYLTKLPSTIEVYGLAEYKISLPGGGLAPAWALRARLAPGVDVGMTAVISGADAAAIADALNPRLPVRGQA